MNGGSRALDALLPLLNNAAVPPRPARGRLPVADADVPIWCPRTPPRNDARFRIYWETVDALAAAHNSGAVPRACDLLVAAFVETRSVYSNDGGPLGNAAAYLRSLGDDCEMTVRSLPDLCAAVPYVPFWGEVGAGCPPALMPWVVSACCF